MLMRWKREGQVKEDKQEVIGEDLRLTGWVEIMQKSGELPSGNSG